jgi:alpha-mannosidase
MVYWRRLPVFYRDCDLPHIKAKGKLMRTEFNEEWRRRAKHWRDALLKHCYRPLGRLELRGFSTAEQLTAEQALAREFAPMPPGTAWGAKWEYGWFAGELTLPEAAAGRRIVVRADAGAESLVWINGAVAGAHDWGHREITLTTSATPGQGYTLLLEAYAGHGTIAMGGGPVRAEQLWPDTPATQTKVGESSFGVWLEDLYQLAIDFALLSELYDRLDPLALRAAEIAEALMDATLIVDLELPEEAMLETVRAGRERLKPALEAVNGTSAPTLFAFGHAHIDVAWLWPLAETERKMARTASNQLALMAEYPEYKFLQSQPHLYHMLRTRYPELYERFKDAVRAGQVIADGAMWVEADTNLSGGESLIRQVVEGRRFFREEFGVDSRVLWLPDVFGYSGALPQILRGCGCVGFGTQKITWAYGGGEPFPYNIFLWEGIDGTSIPAHIFVDYNSQLTPGALLDRWNNRLQKLGIGSMIVAFGWGDGGGGATRDHLEYLRRSHDLQGLPRVRMAGPAEFFQDLDQRGLPKERYVGELYFQAHRGTYTTQAKTKQGNRRAEFALREAELWGTAARALNGFAFTPRSLDAPWRTVLLNQFHDIIPGSSIARVYDEANAAYAQAIEAAQSAAGAAAATFTAAGDGRTIFNSLSWPRSVLVDVPGGQAEVTVPACGWASIPADAVAKRSGAAQATSSTLENEFLRAQFDLRGQIVSLVDKQSGRELAAGQCNAFRLYKDVPGWFDAWDIDSQAEQQPVPLDDYAVTLEVESSGPLVARLRLTRKLHDSTLTQTISLRSGSRRIEFATTVDWRETHKLLKVAFPVAIHANEAIHEIQFGHIRRPTHASRRIDADRFEVCNQKWTALAEEGRGVAILNDCKYGISVHGNSMNLTLLRSAIAPDMSVTDQGQQSFTYALYAWNGSFGESNIVREGYELNCAPLVIRGQPGAAQGALFAVDAPNVVIETIKPAEDGSPDVIVRLYEAMRTATRCTLSTRLPARAASQTDMAEEGQRELAYADGRVELEFRPFEIKTVRLKMSVKG